MGGAMRQFGRRSLRGAAHGRPDCPRRAERRSRITDASVVEGKDRRRPSSIALRRSRYRQIALTAAPLEPLATDPQARLALFLLSATMESAFYPIIGQMERAAGLALDDGLNAKLDKLDALLVQTSGCLKHAMNDAPVGLGAIMRASTESSIADQTFERR